MRRSNHENIDVLMLIGLVTEEGEEGEEEGGGKSHSKVGTRWVRQQLPYDRPQPTPYDIVVKFSQKKTNPAM